MTRPFPTTRRAFLERGLKTAAVGMASMNIVGCARSSMTSPDDEPPSDEDSEQWQIGCYTRPWADHDWRVALDAIAEAGFRYAGLMTTMSPTRLVISLETTAEEAGRVGEEARKRGLKIPSIYGGGFPVETSLEAGIEGLRKLVDNCAAAEAGTLMLGGTGNHDLYDRYYKTVSEVCDYAAERKVGLVLKPHGGLNTTGPQCRKTIERVGHANFTLWYDPGNIYYYSDGQLDPVEDAPAVSGIVTGMCVKDFSMSSKDGKIAKDVMVNPGDGMVDFPAVMTQLNKGGFNHGPLVIETLAPGDLPQLLAAARNARAFVENLVAQPAWCG